MTSDVSRERGKGGGAVLWCMRSPKIGLCARGEYHFKYDGQSCSINLVVLRKCLPYETYEHDCLMTPRNRFYLTKNNWHRFQKIHWGENGQADCEDRLQRAFSAEIHPARRRDRSLAGLLCEGLAVLSCQDMLPVFGRQKAKTHKTHRRSLE